MHSPYSGGEPFFTSLRTENLHKLFRILLRGVSFSSPLFIYLLQYGVMDIYILCYNEIIIYFVAQLFQLRPWEVSIGSSVLLTYTNIAN